MNSLKADKILVESSSVHKKPSWIWRLAFPAFCGVAGIVVTVAISHTPSRFLPLSFGGALVAFIIAHLLWFQKTIQPLRQDLKKLVGASQQIFPPSPCASTPEKEQVQDQAMEDHYLNVLRERLNIAHQPYIQAQSLQDDRRHLIQTKGVLSLLKNHPIEVLVQPVVNFPQKRLSFFSCIPCITAGNGMPINLDTSTNSKNDAGPHPAIDKLVLFQMAQFIRHHHTMYPTCGFICPLSPSVYKDPFSLEETGEFLHQTHFPFSALIFEVPLDISPALLEVFSLLKGWGIRFVGKWPSEELPTDLTHLITPSIDFIKVSYPALLAWTKNQSHRQSLASLNHFLDMSPQVIVSDVDREQDLYMHLPVPFDFAFGRAFGQPKPFHLLQGQILKG